MRLKTDRRHGAPYLFVAAQILTGSLIAIPFDRSSRAQETVITEPTSVNESYGELYRQWKSVLGRLREIRIEYQIAEDDELPSLRDEYRQLVKKGHTLVPRMRAAGIAEYRKSPSEDDEITELLATMLTDEFESDNYEPAFEIAQAMIEGGFEDKQLADWAGRAAFATNRFDLAEQWLRQALESQNISQDGLTFLAEIDNYRSYWEEEQRIRADEAEADDLPRVKFTTSQGDIVVELFENEAPQTVGNFINLVEKGFYDGILFHRVVDHFMAQTGCPQGNGSGGPGYTIYCECYKSNYRKHFRGTLSMAKGTPRDTGGSQFFMTFAPTPWLNGKHTAFGRVIEGIDVLAKIRRRNPDDPKAPAADRIISAKVLRKRDHEYVPTKVR